MNRATGVLLSLLLSLVLFWPAERAAAQEQQGSYWQYTASGRLEHIAPADVNHDGIDEFIIVDESGRVDLLSSSGISLWNYDAGSKVLAVSTANVDGAEEKGREIVLATSNRLVLLNVAGEVLWKLEITLPPESMALLGENGQPPPGVLLSEEKAIPAALTSLDRDNDGREEILVLMQPGRLHLYDGSGLLLWSYPQSSDWETDAEPLMALGDLNRDGRQEIALGRFDPQRRFSLLTLVGGDGQPIWDQDQSVSGRITALTMVTLAGSAREYIATGNNLGQVNLYDGDRQRLWQRTLNKAITTLAPAFLDAGGGLVAGTEVGTIVAFNLEGRRVWSRQLDPDALRSIADISSSGIMPPENHPALSVVLSGASAEDQPADVFLLASNGRLLGSFSTADPGGLSRLTDVNRDANSELLLASVSQIELKGLGLGASEIASGWEYDLLSEPRSVLVVDLDQDGNDDLLFGTQDGRIHSLSNENSLLWLHAPGGAITHLAAISGQSEGLPLIAAIRLEELPGTEETRSNVGWLELRQANGEQIWEEQIAAEVSALAIGELNNQGRPEIIVGTAEGNVLAFNLSGSLLWRTRISSRVEHLLIVSQGAGQPVTLIAASQYQVFSVDPESAPWRMASYPQGIRALYPSEQPTGGLTDSILVFVADGTVRNLPVTRGSHLPQWMLDLGGKPVFELATHELQAGNPTEASDQAFLVATNRSQLLYFINGDGSPSIAWQIDTAGDAVGLYKSDLDGDALPEIAIGDSQGGVRLIRVSSNGQPEELTWLTLPDSVLTLTAIQRRDSQKSDLVAVTGGGLVKLFRAQENWPPLLTGPSTEVSAGQYGIFVTSHDPENDKVTIRLEVQDPQTREWRNQGEKQTDGERSSLFWLLDRPPSSPDGVSYRLFYDDGFHTGYVVPPPGPPVIIPADSAGVSQVSLGLLSVGAGVLLIILLRQSQLPATRARRFYKRLGQDPGRTLELLENNYAHTSGSPDFLLSLANQARQQGDPLVASMADGLFLLADQPHAGLPILLAGLEEASQAVRPWNFIERWQMMLGMGRALLEAPSITELTLLRPQLAQLLTTLEETDQWSPILDALLPILTSLRDSERVELAEDRIVYLNEAIALLHQLQDHLPEFSVRIEKTLVTAVAGRWLSLVTAEVEDLRGRAELTIRLRTKQLAPSERTDVVLEIRNDGRAAAENLIAELDQDPAYDIHSSPQTIRLLPSGRTRQIAFSIGPKVSDRFRVGLSVTFDDRNSRDRVVAFGDMVHLLPPIRDFKTIPNPYLPGTPLRRNSPIFFGRQELFDFITETAGDLAQRNVLILIGERRTGKTSVLLRLEEHLPDYLWPVYIDCQSLGVTPGMPAFLHDLSWYISDALAIHDISVEVPEPAAWQEDPTGRFERKFLPQVRSLMPPGSTLLLVFDEFEAFESLVDDGILPPTLFPYLRHLMQHTDRLSFVFVGTRYLEEMSADYWSVLFNIALYRKIGYLSDESATQLICEPVRPNLVYDDLALDKILRVTTGHPYFLQLVCYTLVKRANSQRNGYATISDVNAAVDEMLRLGEAHFAYLWQRSSFVERALLTTIAHLLDRDLPFHPADLVRALEPYDIHLTPGEITDALNKLVERDILREVSEGAVSLYELRVGLVGLWVARYKSLSSLLTSNGEPRPTPAKKARGSALVSER